MTIIGQSIDAIFVDMRAKEECKTLKIQLKHRLPVLEIPLHELPIDGHDCSAAESVLDTSAAKHILLDTHQIMLNTFLYCNIVIK
jgi:hypothetical protein